jgi:hypothetical protein
VSCATRQASEEGSPLTLDKDNVAEICEEHRHARFTANFEKLLRFLARKCVRLGEETSIDRELDFAVIDARGPKEFKHYFRYLEDRGFIVTSPHDCVALQYSGWEKIDALSAVQPGGRPGTCFVAMWFNPLMDDAYNNGIKPGIVHAGFEPVRVDEVQHNRQITDEIMALIRGAECMVADFTGQRAGVYYEAGFARGLGREVIYTCRETSFKNKHFDTSVINHIVWKDPGDLRKKLTDRIRATILPKA